MAEDITKSGTQKMVSDGLTQKDENSMAIILQELDSVFSNEYKKIELFVSGEKRQCFIMKNGTVFEIIGILPFDCITISYANDITEAKLDFFEEGDQFNAWQDFDNLVKEIREELNVEE